MSDHPVTNVLVLCTHNSARSVLGEALFNRLGEGRIRAWSAGSQPRGAVNPLTLAVLRAKGYDTAFARSQSWDEFAAPGAPPIDLVITVCDSAAAETCPVWPGGPLQVHWGIPDPSAATGSEAERLAAFETAYARMEARVRAFLALDLAGLDAAARRARIAAIGELPL